MGRWFFVVVCLILAFFAVGIVGGVFSPVRQSGPDGAQVNLTLYQGGREYMPKHLARERSLVREYLDYLREEGVGVDDAVRRVSIRFNVDDAGSVLVREGVDGVLLDYGLRNVSYGVPDSSRGYIVEFSGPPLVAYRRMIEEGGTGGIKASAPAHSYRKSVSVMQENAVKEIEGVAGVAVGRRYVNVLNAVSVNASREEAEKIARLPNVKALYPIKEYRALLYNSVPQINADRVWILNDSRGRNVTGVNVTVAVIDTGVDYTHPDFGGCAGPLTSITGNIVNHTVESAHPYEDDLNDTWVITKTGFTEIAVHFEKVDVESGYDYVYVEYPNGTIAQSFTGLRENFWSRSILGDTVRVRFESDEAVTEWGFRVDAVLNGSVEWAWNCSKFAGGYDFVNGDEDPMDDQGHGTHVAGIVAAKGNVSGVAPDAQIVAYKVLDSEGSGMEDDIIAAIERAVDPNQDGDTGDHWDIISMSLGGSGDPFDAMSRAVDNAVDAGVVVVVAAGNSGPDSGTVDCPGCARKAITVGAAHKVNQSEGERNSTLFVTSEDKLEIPSLALEYSNTTSSSGLVRRLEYAVLVIQETFPGETFQKASS